jgi:hypothetical protein
MMLLNHVCMLSNVFFLNFAAWTFSFQTMAELYGVLALILQDGLSLCTVAGEVYIPQ